MYTKIQTFIIFRCTSKYTDFIWLQLQKFDKVFLLLYKSNLFLSLSVYEQILTPVWGSQKGLKRALKNSFLLVSLLVICSHLPVGFFSLC